VETVQTIDREGEAFNGRNKVGFLKKLVGDEEESEAPEKMFMEVGGSKEGG
jgi:hypothetical protein